MRVLAAINDFLYMASLGLLLSVAGSVFLTVLLAPFKEAKKRDYGRPND